LDGAALRSLAAIAVLTGPTKLTMIELLPPSRARGVRQPLDLPNAGSG
jgi:hypothetical protein